MSSKHDDQGEKQIPTRWVCRGGTFRIIALLLLPYTENIKV